MKEWSDFIKSAIRPFIIVWGLVIYGICLLTGIEIPPLLTGLITAITVEYFSERAVKRFKENGREK